MSPDADSLPHEPNLFGLPILSHIVVWILLLGSSMALFGLSNNYAGGIFGAIGKKSLVCLIAAVVTLAAGVACRQLDVAGRFTGPDTWL